MCHVVLALAGTIWRRLWLGLWALCGCAVALPAVRQTQSGSTSRQSWRLPAQRGCNQCAAAPAFTWHLLGPPCCQPGVGGAARCSCTIALLGLGCAAGHRRGVVWPRHAVMIFQGCCLRLLGHGFGHVVARSYGELWSRCLCGMHCGVRRRGDVASCAFPLTCVSR